MEKLLKKIVSAVHPGSAADKIVSDLNKVITHLKIGNINCIKFKRTHNTSQQNINFEVYCKFKFSRHIEFVKYLLFFLLKFYSFLFTTKRLCFLTLYSKQCLPLILLKSIFSHWRLGLERRQRLHDLQPHA